MYGAIAATGENRIAASAHGIGSLCTGAARSESLDGFDFDLGFTENGENAIDGRAVPGGVLTGSQIVDKRNAAHRDSSWESAPGARMQTGACSYLRILRRFQRKTRENSHWHGITLAATP